MPLIVLEGPEGAGKTTQVARLAKRIADAGHQVVSFREPGGTKLGEILRTAVLHTDVDITPAAESLLFMASRAQLTAQEIAPALGREATVLLDRFFLSSYAYQVAGRQLAEDLVVDANRLATGGLVPDLTLLLSLPVAEGLSRASVRSGHDRIERADAGFHERVARGFAEFATPAWQKEHPEAGPIETIDARGSVEAVEARVIAAIRSRLPRLLESAP